jgi:hypothetical protein
MPLVDIIEYSSGYLIVIVEPDPDIRDKGVQALRQSGIQSSLHYPCIADFNGFERVSDADLEGTRQFTRRAITLPFYPILR